MHINKAEFSPYINENNKRPYILSLNKLAFEYLSKLTVTTYYQDYVGIVYE